jgi:phytoene dehydrogenase-like protein
MRDLELPKYGLQILPYEGGAVMTRDGGYLGMFRDHDANRREFARHSARDAEAYDVYARDVLRHCRFIRPLLMRTPPDPASFRPRDLSELAYLGRRLLDLSEAQIHDMIRFWTMSISDYLDQYFENPVIKGYLAVSAIIGTALGPMSPGSAYVLLHHYMGDVDGNIGAWGFARGGMGAITQALMASFVASGGEVRTGHGVERILVRDGRATGVVLANGDELRGARVVSNMDVKRTFLRHVDERELPPAFLKRVRAFKIRGSSGKLNIALDGRPRFTALPDDSPMYRGDLHCTDSIARMERAYDDWKAGRFSADPFQDIMIPTMIDPTMTPPGKHFMSCFVQYAPPKIEGRDWTDADRDAFGRTCIDQIEAYAPGFKDLILHVEVRTPRELEAEVGLTEGNIFQGELTFDQLLFNRPVPGYAQYRTPVRDLWLCGSSTHPGGGVMGAPGRNAAAEILREARRPATMSDAYAVL